MNRDPHDQPPADEAPKTDESKIHTDEVKDRHTTHWDRDYLTTEQLDEAHREGRKKQSENDSAGESDDAES